MYRKVPGNGVMAGDLASTLADRRLLRDSQGWFREGLAARRAARLRQECVECHRALASRRTPYCSRRCRWSFHGRFFWDSARQFVLHRDRFTCRACGRRARKRELEVDHVLEIARGGALLDYANLQTLCRACHRAKTVEFLRARPRTGRRRVNPGNEEPESDWFPA
ncbi:MAG TPA: HNH endonuclease signature motif containing protein [Thermoplasmata archaeon]|nr:HNH endonuclease signature motif containing protein [Thermoplasmata archaeon]